MRSENGASGGAASPGRGSGSGAGGRSSGLVLAQIVTHARRWVASNSPASSCSVRVHWSASVPSAAAVREPGGRWVSSTRSFRRLSVPR